MQNLDVIALKLAELWPLLNSGTLLYTLVHSGALWYTLVHSSTLLYKLVQSGIPKLFTDQTHVLSYVRFDIIKLNWVEFYTEFNICLLYTSPSPRD